MKQICRIVNGPFDLAANLGRFPFNQNYWLEFSATCSSEWNSISTYFQKNFPASFLSIQRCCWKFQNFRLNGSRFGNSKVSGISGNVSGKFLNHLPLFPNFGKFWLNDKRPLAQYNCVIPFMIGRFGPVESS